MSLVGLGAAVLIRGDGAPPAGPDPTVDQPPQPQSPVDILTDDAILTVGGETVALDEVITGSAGAGSADEVRADAAWRVSEGWLVHTINYGELTDEYYGETERLWLVVPNSVHLAGAAEHSVLIVTGHGIMVSPPSSGRPGIQVGWVAGGTLSVGSYIGLNVDTDLEHPGIDGLASTPIPQSPPPHPVRLHAKRAVGSAIILAGTQTGGGLDTWSAWFPERGDYVPALYPSISLLGVTLDRGRIIATYYDTQERCLGELEPDGFTRVRSLCPSPFTDLDRIFPSPDGRWWAVTGPNGTALYAADGIWEGAAAAAYTWPIYSSTGAWSSSTFVTMRQEGVILVDDVNRSPALLAVPLPLAAHGRLIEDLRGTQR